MKQLTGTAKRLLKAITQYESYENQYLYKDDPIATREKIMLEEALAEYYVEHILRKPKIYLSDIDKVIKQFSKNGN